MSASARNRFIHLQSTAQTSQAAATTSRYKQIGDRTWQKWTTFLESIELHRDLFLTTFNQYQRSEIIILFAQFLRSSPATELKRSVPRMVEGSVRNSISVLAQTFMENHVPDPRLDSSGNTTIGVRHILAGFKATDENDKCQKAIPVSIINQIHKLYSRCNNPMSQAIAQLITGAFFFAMRSCEYSKTTSLSESRTTKILTLGNIRFFKDRHLLEHSNPQITSADIVSITFVSQKNKERNQTISMHQSGHAHLCSVKAWSTIVQRIRSYKSSSDNTPVNTVINQRGQLSHITSKHVSTKLRAVAAAIGESALGFSISQIGCHSLRSRSAMAMYLAHVPITTIQLIGRWKSTAFMRYIREKVDCFTSNVSATMLSTKSFFTIPDTVRPLPVTMSNTEDGLFQSTAILSQLVLG